MQLKTFTGKTTAEVLAQIKSELGNEAVILDTQEQNGLITITAALEREQRTAPAAVPAARAAALYADAAAEPFFPSSPATSPGWQNWQEEWSSIKTHLLALMKPALKLDKLAPRQRLALEFLQQEGVSDEALLTLYHTLREDANASVLAPLSRLVQALPWEEHTWGEQVQIIAGPYGAGKTSVVTRLALHLRKTAPDCRFCLINADATRSNGRLLLRHYAELSDIALKEASSALELAGALKKARQEGFQRILVDTPGLTGTTKLHTFLLDAGIREEHTPDTAVHLILTPYYGAGHLRSVLARYKTIFRGSLIWTKLDETEHFGEIINAALSTGLPVSALSCGPSLGATLIPAQEDMLWRLIFKREMPIPAPGQQAGTV